MFLQKKTNGIWIIVYTKKDGKRSSKSTGTKLKREANKFLTEFAIQLKEEREQKFIPITLKQLRWEYLKYSESFHTWKTTLTYRTTFNKVLKYFGDIPLTELSRKRIEEYIQDEIRTVSIHSARKELINIKSFLNWSVNSNYLLENPSKTLKRIKVPEKLPVYYSKEEFQKLLSVIEDQDIKDLVIFAVNTGLRMGELLSLQSRQFIPNSKSIILDNHTHTTKSKKIRTIPLNKSAYEIIERRSKKNDLIFTIEGKRIIQDTFVHVFKRYVKKVDVNQKLTFHSLRHTFASWLVQSGVSIFQVSKLLGHADIKTTEIYAHLRNDDLQRSVEILDMDEEQ